MDILSRGSIALSRCRDESVCLCSVFGIDESRAIKIHEAIGGECSFVATIPPVEHVMCGDLLDRMLILFLAFSRTAYATSGEIHLDDVLKYKLGKLIYMALSCLHYEMQPGDVQARGRKVVRITVLIGGRYRG